MQICYLFPGQGSQSVGMGKKLWKVDIARGIFLTANRILDFDITDMMFNGPKEELDKTINAQPAILVANMAYYKALKKKFASALNMGHSVGEYSALVASKALCLEDAIMVVRKRAELMSECIPEEQVRDKTSHMAAVIGECAGLVYEACDRFSQDGNIVQIANINSPTQMVISGNNGAVIRAADYMKERNHAVRVIYLNVEGPFHSDLMRGAAGGMREALRDVEITKPLIPFVANVIGDYLWDPQEIKEKLVEQVYRTILWRQSLKRAFDEGYSFLESGEGDVQRNLVRKNYGRDRVLDRDHLLS